MSARASWMLFTEQGGIALMLDVHRATNEFVTYMASDSIYV